MTWFNIVMSILRNMAPTSTILRLTYLAVAVLSCGAFIPSVMRTCSSVTSLSAINSDVNNRRSFIATAGITLIGGNNIANAAEEEKPSKPKRLPLDSYLYQILRVREVGDSCAYQIYVSNMLYLCR